MATKKKQHWYVVFMRASASPRWVVIAREQTQRAAVSAAGKMLSTHLDAFHRWVDIRIERQKGVWSYETES